MGRVGSFAAHGSGEIVVGFSTANTVPRQRDRPLYQMTVLGDRFIDPMYQAAIEATEEAILNALCMASPMTAARGHEVPALPLDVIRAHFGAAS